MTFPWRFVRGFLRAERASEAPLWNPHVMGGRPFIGNAQSAVFSPFLLPAYILPFGLAIGVIAWLKLVVAALGTFLLSRALRIGWPGAFLAGLAYAFGLTLVTWLLIVAPASAWALMPWLLLPPSVCSNGRDPPR